MSTQQNARTPQDFLRAIERKFKVKFVFDLACTRLDCVVARSLADPDKVQGYYFDCGIDALKQDWTKLQTGRVLPDGTEEVAWLNPPWRDIKPWANKLSGYASGTYTAAPLDDGGTDLYWEPPPLRVFSLFPHGTSSQWRRMYVQGNVDIYNLAPRVPYLNPETGDYYRTESGSIKTSQTDAILVDWAGTGLTQSWNWEQTLQELANDEG